MGKGVVVFGSFAVDLTSRSKGLPLPGQTLLGSSFALGAGGKGSNQAVAAHRAGAEATLITKLGGDVFADVALDFYRREGMRTDYVLRDPAMATGAAVIMVDEESAQNAIVVVSGACGAFTGEDVALARPIVEGADVLLVQLEVNFEALFKVIALARAAGARVVLNPAPAAELPDEVLAMTDVITPNETEACALTGVEVTDEASASRAAAALLKRGVGAVVITMGGKGAFASDGKRCELVAPLPVKAVDTTGAGDAFNGALAAALSEGRDLFAALRFANAAGALSVTKLGTAASAPARADIDAFCALHYGR